MNTKMPDDERIKYLEKYADHVSDVPKEERDYFLELVELGCKEEWIPALHIKGYGCYGGNDFFECDWKTSEQCMLKLIELTDNPYHYNTLGYIYYYGRVNNGVPEYDKAFQYFSVGAANGLFESTYKLADMFLAGKGCIKSKNAGASLILSIYNENRENFCNEHFEGEFADVALRLGGLYERGDGVEKDIEKAYAHYLEAETAIKERVSRYDFYGDKKVERNIKEALERVIPILPMNFFSNFVTYREPWFIGDLLSNSAGLDLTLYKEKGFYRLEAEGFKSETANGTTLVNVPELKYCKLVKKVTMYLDISAEVLSNVGDLPFKVFITSISYDEDSKIWSFLCGDRVMLQIKTSGFMFCDK